MPGAPSIQVLRNGRARQWGVLTRDIWSEDPSELLICPRALNATPLILDHYRVAAQRNTLSSRPLSAQLRITKLLRRMKGLT